MKEIGSIFPLYEKTASPPALPRREGAGVLNGENDSLSEEKFVSEPAPSLRGRAGGEAVLLSFCREAIYLIASKELSHGKKVMLPKYRTQITFNLDAVIYVDNKEIYTVRFGI